MKPHQEKGFRRLLLAAKWSLRGLRATFAHEAAFRQELVLAAVFVPLGLFIGTNPAEKACLAGSILLVLIVELLNSSMEAAVDRIGEEMHPLAARAKDMGSAAVFISLLNALLIWVIILLF
jgi:diacylglycerol kinase (ATP)